MLQHNSMHLAQKKGGDSGAFALSWGVILKIAMLVNYLLPLSIGAPKNPSLKSDQARGVGWFGGRLEAISKSDF